MPNKECINCGKEFDPVATGRHKFCSTRCSRYYHNKIRSHDRTPMSEHPATITCVMCGKEFKTAYRGRMYCGDSCRQRAVRQKKNQNKISKICKYCGQVFYTKYPNSQYCSRACKVEANHHIDATGQLCWTCQRYCGSLSCSWAKDFTPVEGWVAEPSKNKYDGEPGWRIKECPEYIPDDEVRGMV